MRTAPHSSSAPATSRGKSTPAKRITARFSVELAPKLAAQVHKLAVGDDLSMSKAIAELVGAGLEERSRKRKFFSKLKQNLSDTSPTRENRMVDEFRSLILGR